jgi:dTMP kinase
VKRRVRRLAKLIVIDGIDGSGKATQSAKLQGALLQKGEKVKKISFPDYNAKSSTLVKMYLAGDFGLDANLVNPYAVSTFYAVDRFASFSLGWKRDYLSFGYIIADRYVTSNAIHQMSKLNEDEWGSFLCWSDDLEYGKFGLPRPEITIYLDVDPEICAGLLTKRCNETRDACKDLHERDINYLKDCRKAAIYAADKLSWKVIACCDKNGLLPEGIIERRIFDVLTENNIV